MKIIILSIVLLAILSALFLYKKPSLKSTNIPNTTANKTNVNKSEKIQVGESPDSDFKIPEGFKIGVFAKDLPNARDLEFTPGGTLLVSLTASGKVIALPDRNSDGVADEKIEILNGLKRPHGLAFYKDNLFVAEENKVTRYDYDSTNNKASFDKKLFDLPLGGRHFTRSLLFDNNGNLYVSLGSTCDTCAEKNQFIASVLVSNSEGENLRIYSSGLRNAVFLALSSDNKIYATEMGRDFLGDNTPSDEIDVLNEGGNYGWPYCYGDRVWDKVFGRKNQSFCDKTVDPYFKIQAHSAPLGLTFINSSQMEKWNGDLLVSYHGSWNRSTPVGYKIVRITTNGNPTETDFISGFSKDKARPVDVIFDPQGSLFISDDKAGQIYKMIKTN